MALLITADDAGASLEVNEAIRRSCVDGYVNSVAFLVNLPDVHDAVERVGPRVSERSLHLNFVEGRPLALGSDSPLVDAEGWFRHQSAGLLAAYYRGSGRMRARISADIRAETVAQLRAFQAFFPGPVAVDSHQHTHMFPFVLPQVLAAAESLGLAISRLRWPVERLTARECLSVGGVKAMALAAMARRNRTLIRGAGVQGTTASFCGVVHTGRMTSEVVARFLSETARMPASELAELLIHPGGGVEITEAWARSHALRDFYTSPWRGRELDLAQDAELGRATHTG